VSATDARGVSCEANSNGLASQCTVLRNGLIQGASSSRIGISIGVACVGGGCSRVAGNVITGNLGGDVVGVVLRGTAAAVQRNKITGGCGTRTAAGLLAEDVSSRIDDNLVSGGSCNTSGSTATPTPETAGLHVHNADGPSEPDIHSNTIDGAGSASACTSMGVDWSLGSNLTLTGPKGMVRNNIIRAGLCNTRWDFAERDHAADPRLFQNNDLDPTGTPAALYRNEGSMSINSSDEVNRLNDITAAGNFSADPMFVSYPGDLHLGAGSACVNAGTTQGAPAIDFDGKPREPTKPDVGAYER
jgi:hypothetical protein